MNSDYTSVVFGGVRWKSSLNVAHSPNVASFREPGRERTFFSGDKMMKSN